MVTCSLAVLTLAPGAPYNVAASAPQSWAYAIGPSTAAMPAVVATITPTPTTVPIATPLPTAAPTAMPRPSATPQLSALPSVYYRDGATIYAVNPDGGTPSIVVTLPFSGTFAPQLLPDGRLLYATGVGSFAVVDRYGRRYALRAPDLNAGECIWTVTPSPDARELAWQILNTTQPDSCATDPTTVRVALTGRFGDAGTTALSAQFDANGQAPVVLGWRRTSPYSMGGSTLLLQDLYGKAIVGAGILPNTPRGLLEYDPAIGDLVNDYLPPYSSDIPRQRAFAVSADGAWAVYGDANAFTPSGEGPLATMLDALNLNSSAAVHLDLARYHPTKQVMTTVTKRKKGKRTVTHKTTTTLRIYQYFSHHAYVAPGDGRVLYTLLTVSYPQGALQPRVQHTTLVTTIDGRTHTFLANDADGEGWLSDRVAVVKKRDGLYAVDVVNGGSTRLASGAAVQYIGAQ